MASLEHIRLYPGGGPSEVDCEAREDDSVASSPRVSSAEAVEPVEPICFDELWGEHDIQALWKEFPSDASARGVTANRVVLQGIWGSGKRQVAARFAREFARAHQRQILWIEGFAHTSFIQDFARAFEQITDTEISPNVGTYWRLHQIQQFLNQCPERWFMVISDLNPYLQDENTNPSGLSLTSFLPRGQILITHTSDGVFYRIPAGCSVGGPSLLTSTTISSTLSISTPDLHEFTTMCRLIYPSTQHPTPWTEEVLNKFRGHRLTIMIGCATARLMGIPMLRYCQMLTRRQGKLSANSHSPMFNQGRTIALFNCALQLFFDAVRDRNCIAVAILRALSCVSDRAVPLHLLRQLRVFRSCPRQDLDDALELLQRASIISMRRSDRQKVCIDMHVLTHMWLRHRASQADLDGISDYADLTTQWCVVLEKYAPELESHLHESSQRSSKVTTYWSLFHLTTAVFRAAEQTEVFLTALVSLLRKFATFMSQHLLLPGTAMMYFRIASVVCSALLRENNERPNAALPIASLEYEQLKIHRELASLLTLMGDSEQAWIHLGLAKRSLESIELPPDDRQRLGDSLFDDCIELFLREQEFDPARNMITDALTSPSYELSHERRARMHYWAAVSVGDGHSAVLSALNHSHKAMTYWMSRPGEDRWSPGCLHRTACIDVHVDLLLQMNRARLALVLLPGLLEAYIHQCRPEHEKIWRVAYLLVREHNAIDEHQAAEKVAHRVLSLCPADTLRDSAFTWAILMLESLAYMLVCTGRLFEGELVLKWCLATIHERRADELQPQSGVPLPLASLWLWLVRSLVIQGKLREAKAARELTIERDFAVFKCNDWIETAISHYRFWRIMYEKALQAAQDRVANVYNRYDMFLDGEWPKLFSPAIAAFGDPFDRIDRRLDDLDEDLLPTRHANNARSELLDCLGFTFHNDGVESGSDVGGKHDLEPGNNWHTVFEKDAFNRSEDQTALAKYWPWCTCQRKRQRSRSIQIGLLQQKQHKVRKQHQQLTQVPLRQELITRYLTVRRKRSQNLCSDGCPCIKANIEGKNLTKQLERERLFTYQPPNPEWARRVELVRRDLLYRYRIRYGPRPPIPYAMTFDHSWRSKWRGPTEANEPYRRQSELFWEPDCFRSTLRTDDNDPCGEPENAIITNLAAHQGNSGTLSIPSISITSYTLGEEVRALVDPYGKPRRWKKTYIEEYFRRASADEDDRIASGQETPPDLNDKGRFAWRRGRSRERKIKRRLDKKAGLIRRSRSRSPSTSTGPITRTPSPIRPEESSMDRRRDAAHINESRNVGNNNNHDDHQCYDKDGRIKLFNIGSVHAGGPIFGRGEFNPDRLQLWLGQTQQTNE